MLKKRLNLPNEKQKQSQGRQAIKLYFLYRFGKEKKKHKNVSHRKKYSIQMKKKKQQFNV